MSINSRTKFRRNIYRTETIFKYSARFGDKAIINDLPYINRIHSNFISFIFFLSVKYLYMITYRIGSMDLRLYRSNFRHGSLSTTRCVQRTITRKIRATGNTARYRVL